MAIFVVTYEKRTPGKDYGPLHKAIQDNAIKWWHYLTHTWIVQTHMTADQFAKLLYPYITKDDYLLVAKLSGQHQGWLPDDAWKWLNEQNYY